MKPKWIAGIAVLSLVITVLTFHIYIDGEPRPVVEAFSSLISPSDESDLWSCSSDPSPITDGSSRCENPVWSPDGRTIAFESEGWIYTADVEGGDTSRLVEGSDPIFSSTGDRIRFLRPIEAIGEDTDHRVNGIEVLSIDLHAQQLATVAKLENIVISSYADSPTQEDHVVWSPSGKQAVLRVVEPPVFRYSRQNLAIWDIQSNDLKTIDASVSFWPPSWSPDEQTLVCAGIPDEGFSDGQCRKPDLWLVDVGNGQLTMLTATPDTAEENPVWSPDGSKIAFASFDGFDETGCMSGGLARAGDICTIAPDGSDRNVMVSRGAPWMMTYENTMAWRPDGSSVAYFTWGLWASGENTAELSQELWVTGGVVHEADGGLSAKVWNPLLRAPLREGFLGDISWSPKGDKLAYEWTPCEITVKPSPVWGVQLQIKDYIAPTQLIYVVDVPKE